MVEIDEREEELSTLSAIYPELVISAEDPFSATLELPVTPAKPLLVRFVPAGSRKTTDSHTTYARAAANGGAHIEHDVELVHLPPITLDVKLPNLYPTELPPKVQLSTQHDWLPKSKLSELEQEVNTLWEEYGRCQILFAYIDYLQQAAERGFDLDQSAEGCLVLPVTEENDLVAFDSETRQKIFNAGTYDCGICLEPKKGSSCYQLKDCGHVFCRECLQDFYNNAISEGDVVNVKCLSPDCGKDEGATAGKRKRKKEHTLSTRELLDMGVEEGMVRRYVEMKRKKKLEADKSTVYCPRTWCQGPAKSAKYPPIPADLSTYTLPDTSDDEGDDADQEQNAKPLTKAKNTKNIPPNPNDRLAVCEKCSLAFCKVCYMGWHGPYARCYPRDPSELSAEEKASYDYIRLNTSPCPYCNSPTQKTMGCNHMKCYQCNTHYCYLCSSWLDGDNPYAHFNKAGSPCYQRLWELEEGDEGQGPGDGRGFIGARGWEQLAVEAAREAEEQEAAAAAAAAQAEADAEGDKEEDDQEDEEADEARIQAALAQLAINEAIDEQRRARPPDPRRVQNANRNIVRRPPRNRPADLVGRRERVGEEQRQQQELQRFLDLAERDEEDGWDSDELGDDDEGFVIHERPPAAGR